MNKFEIAPDPFDPTLVKLTYWSTTTSGQTFRMARTDLQDLVNLIQTYQGANPQ